MSYDTIGLDYYSAREATPRWYGVSTGDGNSGVSHMFPDYYVRTKHPWCLAERAALACIADNWRDAAKDALVLDGEPDYTIYATIFDPLDYEPEDEDDEGWSAYNGAWFCLEVFPVEHDEIDNLHHQAPTYHSLSAAGLRLAA